VRKSFAVAKTKKGSAEENLIKFLHLLHEIPRRIQKFPPAADFGLLHWRLVLKSHYRHRLIDFSKTAFERRVQTA
jgi:hypothetical protein